MSSRDWGSLASSSVLAMAQRASCPSTREGGLSNPPVLPGAAGWRIQGGQKRWAAGSAGEAKGELTFCAPEKAWQ